MVPDIRFMLWNMEWMNDLFVSGEEGDPPVFRSDTDEPAHHGGPQSASGGTTSRGRWASSPPTSR